MRIWMKIGAAAVGAAVVLWAVTVNGSLEVLGTLRANIVDFSGAVSSAPMKVGTSMPGSCSVGQAFFKTDATAGQNIYLCTASNTWTQVQGSGGGGAWNMKPDARYMLLRSEMNSTWGLGTPAYTGDFSFGRTAGSQGINNPNVSDDGRPGVYWFSTTTTSGNRSLWFAALSQSATSDSLSLYGRTNQEWEMVYIFRYRGAADYAASTFYAGMMAATSDNPPQGVGVRYIAGTDSAFMFYASTTNSWGTPVSSGVAPDANWHKVRLRSDGATVNKMWISLDGGTERSICPSGCDLAWATYSTSAVTAFGINLTTNEAVQKVLGLDYLHLWADWGTR